MSDNVIIAGAGSVGTFFKERLCNAQLSPQLFGRHEFRLHQPLAPASIVILTPKLVDLKSCIREIVLPDREARKTGQDLKTIFVLIQNGLKICDEFVPQEWLNRSDISVVRAMLWFGSRLDRSTRILYTTDVDCIELAGAPGDDDSVERVVHLFESAQIPVRRGASIDEVEWRKAYWNVALNALGALAGVTNQEVLDRPDLRARFELLLVEAAAVARSCGVQLTDADRERVISATRKVGSNRNSMLQDLEAGRVTELAWLNERLIELGQKNGVSTTNHEETVRDIHRHLNFRHAYSDGLEKNTRSS